MQKSQTFYLPACYFSLLPPFPIWFCSSVVVVASRLFPSCCNVVRNIVTKNAYNQLCRCAKDCFTKSYKESRLPSDWGFQQQKGTFPVKTKGKVYLVWRDLCSALYFQLFNNRLLISIRWGAGCLVISFQCLSHFSPSLANTLYSRLKAMGFARWWTKAHLMGACVIPYVWSHLWSTRSGVTIVYNLAAWDVCSRYVTQTNLNSRKN